MSIDWFKERLADFNFTLDEDFEEEILNTLNGISVLHKIKNDDVVDSVTALLLNQKKDELSMHIVDDFKNSVSTKQKQKPVSANSNIKEAQAILQRSILKEIPILGAGTEFEDTYDFALEDLDISIAPIPGKAHIAFDKVKISYVGSSFSPSDETDAMDIDELPSLKILSDCTASSFGYGDNGAFNLCEIFEEDAKASEIGEEKEAGIPVVLSGNLVATDGSKLNFENAGLYTSSKIIPVNFDCIDHVALFPGKHVTVRGEYNDKKEFIAQSIIQSSNLPPAKLNHNGQRSRIKVITAAGPFSLKEDDVSFAKLVEHAIRYSANALVMVGPFLKDDFEANGALSPEEIFQQHLQTISKLVSKLKLRVFIIPCHSDINALPLFPTPPYLLPEFLLADNVTVLGDPAIFEVGGIQFAVSASEVICHLSKREIYKFEEMENLNEDRMSRLIGHLFSSKSLYPLYPADASLPFVLKKSKQKITLLERPHVLILPSVLQPCVKVVEDCICVNPGRFIRGKSGGTFASMEIDVSSSVVDSVAPHSEVNIGQ
uniref:DNA polymerase alpha subunit B n=1 Tax=Ditylenchus dipsaci TaxID=166011 RepID=A0A915ERN5_9BILA